MEHTDISVVISTYNRCDILPAAVESLLNQHAPGVNYEIIIVDNNSTDCTKKVVESIVRQGHHNLRYVFEAKQGAAHGRNAGIANARGAIIAFTDDDVRAERDWIANIKRAFDRYTDVDCVGGKMLPRWKSAPPNWLTTDHWGPLAIADYGDRILRSTAGKPVFWSTSNMSFRSTVFERIGGFSGDFLRSQDRELVRRFLRAGGQALYVPDIVVTVDVPQERLIKAYHRRWHMTKGKYHALMRLAETTGSDGEVLQEPIETINLFGVPGFLYRDLMTQCGKCFLATIRRQESLAFNYENRMRYLIGYIRKRYEHEFASRNRSHFLEVGRFIKAILQRKVNLGSARLYKRN